jgi:hypothetical protein
LNHAKCAIELRRNLDEQTKLECVGGKRQGVSTRVNSAESMKLPDLPEVKMAIFGDHTDNTASSLLSFHCAVGTLNSSVLSLFPVPSLKSGAQIRRASRTAALSAAVYGQLVVPLLYRPFPIISVVNLVGRYRGDI